MGAMEERRKEHRQWLDKTGQWLIPKNEEQVLKALQGEGISSLRDIAISLDILKYGYGVRALSGINDATQPVSEWAGWLKQSTLCRYWSLAIRCEIFFERHRLQVNSTSLTSLTSDLANLVCLFYVVQEISLGRHCAGLLSRCVQTPDALQEGFWESRWFEPGVLTLAGQWGWPVVVSTQGSRRDWWQELWEGTESQTEQACQRHLEEMVERDPRMWQPPFDEAPFDLIAWEILAVQRWALGEGRVVPSTIHPLLPDISAVRQSWESLPVSDWFAKVEQLYCDTLFQ